MKDKILLITGGTGTLGLALVKWLHWEGPIRILSRDEQKHEELRKALQAAGDTQIRLILGDIRDRHKTRMAIARAHTVLHVAALKIVPQASYNPDELIKTNILGSMNVIEESIAAGVERVLCISSDKGVEPTTLYGATKMAMEHYAQSANQWSPTRVSCVRLGNIEGSRGSITTFFQDIAGRGEAIPITDEAMTRFWISQRGAVSFIQRALDRMEGGEIFAPKLPAARIMDAVPKGATWRIIGRRPGEREFELLLGTQEIRHADEERDLFIVRPWPYQGTCRRTRPYSSADYSTGRINPPAEQVPIAGDEDGDESDGDGLQKG